MELSGLTCKSQWSLGRQQENCSKLTLLSVTFEQAISLHLYMQSCTNRSQTLRDTCHNFVAPGWHCHLSFRVLGVYVLSANFGFGFGGLRFRFWGFGVESLWFWRSHVGLRWEFSLIGNYWVAVKQLKLNYYNKETQLCTIYP